MPPILHHQIVKLRDLDFADIIRKQRYRLSARWSQQSIELIEQEFQELRAAYEREPSLKQVLDQCDVNNTFENRWNYVKHRSAPENVLWRLGDRVSGHVYSEE